MKTPTQNTISIDGAMILTRLLAGGLGLALLIASLYFLAINKRAAAVVARAELVEQSGGLSIAETERLLRSVGQVGPALVCNIAGLKAQLDTSLRLADDIVAHAAASANGANGQMMEAIVDAQQAARHLLACSPADGDAWFRLAILEAFLTGDEGPAPSYLAQSQAYAPNEGWLVDARLQAFEPYITEGTPSRFAVYVQTDRATRSAAR